MLHCQNGAYMHGISKIDYSSHGLCALYKSLVFDYLLASPRDSQKLLSYMSNMLLTRQAQRFRSDSIGVIYRFMGMGMIYPYSVGLIYLVCTCISVPFMYKGGRFNFFFFLKV